MIPLNIGEPKTNLPYINVSHFWGKSFQKDWDGAYKLKGTLSGVYRLQSNQFVGFIKPKRGNKKRVVVSGYFDDNYNAFMISLPKWALNWVCILVSEEGYGVYQISPENTEKMSQLYIGTFSGAITLEHREIPELLTEIYPSSSSATQTLCSNISSIEYDSSQAGYTAMWKDIQRMRVSDYDLYDCGYWN